MELTAKEVIAQVVRTGSGYWKKNGDYNVNDPDYGSYLPVAEYQITGTLRRNRDSNRNTDRWQK